MSAHQEGIHYSSCDWPRACVCSQLKVDPMDCRDRVPSWRFSSGNGLDTENVRAWVSFMSSIKLFFHPKSSTSIRAFASNSCNGILSVVDGVLSVEITKLTPPRPDVKSLWATWLTNSNPLLAMVTSWPNSPRSTFPPASRCATSEALKIQQTGQLSTHLCFTLVVSGKHMMSIERLCCVPRMQQLWCYILKLFTDFVILDRRKYFYQPHSAAENFAGK